MCKCQHGGHNARVVAILLLLIGIVGVATVGFRWWTIIWFALAPLEFFNKLSIAPLVVKYRFKRNPKFGETSNIHFSDDGIHFKTSSIDSKLKWDLYDGLLEDEELFLLLYGGQMYSVIPKRCFTEDERTDAFRNLVRSKVHGAQKS